MPRPKADFDDLRPLEFRDPDEVLDEGEMYTIYEVGRLLQGVDPEAQLDVETENVLLDWAIPWMITHSDAFVFAEPESDAEAGYYGLATGDEATPATGDEATPATGDEATPATDDEAPSATDE